MTVIDVERSTARQIDLEAYLVVQYRHFVFLHGALFKVYYRQSRQKPVAPGAKHVQIFVPVPAKACLHVKFFGQPLDHRSRFKRHACRPFSWSTDTSTCFADFSPSTRHGQRLSKSPAPTHMLNDRIVIIFISVDTGRCPIDSPADET